MGRWGAVGTLLREAVPRGEPASADGQIDGQSTGSLPWVVGLGHPLGHASPSGGGAKPKGRILAGEGVQGVGMVRGGGSYYLFMCWCSVSGELSSLSCSR